MAKLKLQLEDLRIDSFDTTPTQKPKGTVFGEQCTCYTNCTCPGCPTCDASCNGTCDASACNGTCDASCNGTCGASCDFTCAWTCDYTCGDSCGNSCDGYTCPTAPSPRQLCRPYCVVEWRAAETGGSSRAWPNAPSPASTLNARHPADPATAEGVMPKLKLQLEDLAIDSFQTTPPESAKGTVLGEQCTCWTRCGQNTCPGCPTCDASCNGTCVNTCANTCDDVSCAGTCDASCNGSCQCSGYDTCWYSCAGSCPPDTCDMTCAAGGMTCYLAAC
jgi:hypothetical protein